jgi:hypothetical protein
VPGLLHEGDVLGQCSVAGLTVFRRATKSLYESDLSSLVLFLQFDSHIQLCNPFSVVS